MKKPNKKKLYFKKSEYSKKNITDLKQELELRFKTGDFDPWRQDVEIITPDESTSTRKACEEYLQHKSRQIAANTYQRYSDTINYFLKKNPLIRYTHELSESILTEFCNEEHITYSTRTSRRNVLTGWCTWMAEKKYIPSPIRIVVTSNRADRKGPSKAWITSAELELVIQALCTIDDEKQSKNDAPNPTSNRLWMADLFRIAFYTGMRRSELMNMKVGWIHTDFIYIGDAQYRAKSQNAVEVVPIMPEVREILTRLKAGKTKHQRLFSHTREDWPAKVFKECVRRVLPKKAPQLNFHCLRHSAAMYWLYERDLPLRMVQELLRHSSIRTTEIYLHYHPTTLLKALSSRPHTDLSAKNIG